MEFLSQSWTGEEVQWFLAEYLSGILFYAGMIYFLFEIGRYLWLKQMSWRWVGDAVTNFLTFIAFPFVSQILGAAFFISLFFYAYENWALLSIPINAWTIVIAIVLADFVYYWEHRFMHMTGIGWMTHTVHHSSPEFNISVAYRHGPLDAIFGLHFLLPLVFLGFDTFIVLL